MKRFLLISGVALAVAGLAVAAQKATIADLLKTPEKFDGKVVTVRGKVVKFQQKTSKAGNDYFTMKLVDDKDERISVYGRGKHKELKDDVSVEVTGKFAKEKKVGDVTFKLEVDVTKDEKDKATKDFGIKEVK